MPSWYHNAISHRVASGLKSGHWRCSDLRAAGSPEKHCVVIVPFELAFSERDWEARNDADLAQNLRRVSANWFRCCDPGEERIAAAGSPVGRCPVITPWLPWRSPGQWPA